MSKHLLSAAAACALLLSSANTRGERVPSDTIVQGDQPIITLVAAGRMKDLYLVDAYVQGVADLRSYQVTVKTTGGRAGKMELAGVVVNRSRADYVFGAAEAITAESTLSSKVGAVAYDAGVTVEGWKYLGTYLFRPTADAAGEFRVSITRTGASSLLADTAHNELEFISGPDAVLAVRPRPSAHTTKIGSSKE